MTPEEIAAVVEIIKSEHGHVIPPALMEAVEFLFRVALIIGSIGIPVFVYRVSKASGIRRATLDTIRNLGTAPEIISRLSRLYRYRLHEEAKVNGALAGKTVNPPLNPYEGQNEFCFLFDSIIVLNYYEAICTDISKKILDEELFYEVGRDLLVGLKEIILARYERVTGIPGYQSYPYLDEVAGRWNTRAREEKKTIFDRIPTVR